MSTIEQPKRSTRRQEHLLDALGAVPLFSALQKAQLQTIAAHTSEIRVPAGTALVESGAAPASLSILTSGSVVVIIDGEPIASLGKGEVIGEFALVDDAPSPIDVVATEATTVWRVERSVLAPLQRKYPGVTTALLEGIVGRLREANISLASLRPAS